MKPREISSTGNPLLKLFRRALGEGTTREGLVAVEGPRVVEEALADPSSARVHSVLVSQGGARRFSALLERLPQEAELALVADRLFEHVAATEAPQGVAALVELLPRPLEAILSRSQLLLVVACGLKDPGNLGTILRSAQALGADALFTLPATVSPLNPKCVRSSAGAIFRLPLFFDSKAAELFPRLRASGVRIIAAEPRSPRAVAHADLSGSIALLIGEEAAGLEEQCRHEADLELSIPLQRGTDSINAAAAASIFLYEAARQRGFAY